MSDPNDCFHLIAGCRCKASLLGIRARLFPLQKEWNRDYKLQQHTEIPWSVAEKAYAVYSARYGRDQTLERLAERGGFGNSEMDRYYPTWREEISEIGRLTRERDEVSVQHQTQLKFAKQAAINAEQSLAEVRTDLLAWEERVGRQSLGMEGYVKPGDAAAAISSLRRFNDETCEAKACTERLLIAAEKKRDEMKRALILISQERDNAARCSDIALAALSTK